MSEIYRLSYTRFVVLLVAVSCFTALGCRSPIGKAMGKQSCQDGSCGADLSSNQEPGQTKAELFAEMNYQQVAAEQANEANHAAIAARVPRGPNSLFAGMR